MYDLFMGKLDEVKEILNTLRVAMSIAFAILLFVIGAIVKRYDNQNVDDIFWLSIVVIVSILVSIIFIVRKITKKTREIREL